MILLFPTLKKGCGSGHLKRMIRLHHQLPDSAVYLEQNDNPVYFPLFDDCRASVIIGTVPSEAKAVVFDNFRTTRSQLDRFPQEMVRIGVDEGGAARSRFDYLLDILPAVKKQQAPNYASLAFLNREDYKRRKRKTIKSILVSFGGEDRAGLAQKTADYLQAAGWHRKYRITLLSPQLKAESYPGFEIVSRIPDLSLRVTGWDLVLTHFGLTAFEALFQNVPVILINPTAYHHRLTVKAGLPEAGVGSVKTDVLEMYLSQPELTESVSRPFLEMPRESLGQFFEKRHFTGSPVCPVCGRRGKVMFRDKTRTVYRCRRCSLYYQLLFKEPEERYREDYFFSEYRQSYGRTYLEDFDSISAMGEVRLDCLEPLRRTVQSDCRLRLLDVGCAYGPFLKAAAARGWEAAGCEVCAEAAEYVRKEFGIPVLSVPFEDYPENGLKFNAVTMWYVIEHFEHPGAVLEKVSRLLSSDGILAFSTPNGSGWSARKSLRQFLEKSPEDHYTILTPRGVRKILKRYGYRVERIRITGIHPERIWNHRSAESLSPRLYRFLYHVFRLLRWGDTFEVYAKKK